MQEIILENIFVLFLFCNPTDNFDRDGNGTLIIVSKAIVGLPYAFSGKNYIRNGGCLYFVRL
jgi:hypothetical protein